MGPSGSGSATGRFALVYSDEARAAAGFGVPPPEDVLRDLPVLPPDGASRN